MLLLPVMLLLPAAASEGRLSCCAPEKARCGIFFLCVGFFFPYLP
jgi:hypothetical protein